jgi:excisionase family DNA binding protein
MIHPDAPDDRKTAAMRLADKPPLLTVREAAWCLGLSPASVWRLIAQKRLKVHRLGRATRVNRSSVEALLAALDAGEELTIRERTTPAERRAGARAADEKGV